MKKVEWTMVAKGRARAISRYIAQDNSIAAQQWLNDVFRKTEQLGTFPESGRHVPESGRTDLREIFHGEYRIIYRYDGHTVYVLTVRHGKQILPSGELIQH